MDRYIYIKRKSLSRESCENLINHLEKSDKGYYNERGYYGVDTCASNFSPVQVSLTEGLDEYVKKHKFLSAAHNHNPSYRWRVDSQAIIKKFLPGEYYLLGEHMENGCVPHDALRVLAWMFYLNDIKHKGGTCWPQQRFTSKPRVGDLYIWPSGWTHSHYGIPAPKENKYFISGWCSLMMG